MSPHVFVKAGIFDEVRLILYMCDKMIFNHYHMWGSGLTERLKPFNLKLLPGGPKIEASVAGFLGNGLCSPGENLFELPGALLRLRRIC